MIDNSGFVIKHGVYRFLLKAQDDARMVEISMPIPVNRKRTADRLRKLREELKETREVMNETRWAN